MKMVKKWGPFFISSMLSLAPAIAISEGAHDTLSGLSSPPPTQDAASDTSAPANPLARPPSSSAGSKDQTQNLASVIAKQIACSTDGKNALTQLQSEFQKWNFRMTQQGGTSPSQNDWDKFLGMLKDSLRTTYGVNISEGASTINSVAGGISRIGDALRINAQNYRSNIYPSADPKSYEAMLHLAVIESKVDGRYIWDKEWTNIKNSIQALYVGGKTPGNEKACDQTKKDTKADSNTKPASTQNIEQPKQSKSTAPPSDDLQVATNTAPTTKTPNSPPLTINTSAASQNAEIRSADKNAGTLSADTKFSSTTTSAAGGLSGDVSPETNSDDLTLSREETAVAQIKTDAALATVLAKFANGSRNSIDPANVTPQQLALDPNISFPGMTLADAVQQNKDDALAIATKAGIQIGEDIKEGDFEKVNKAIAELDRFKQEVRTAFIQDDLLSMPKKINKELSIILGGVGNELKGSIRNPSYSALLLISQNPIVMAYLKNHQKSDSNISVSSQALDSQSLEGPTYQNGLLRIKGAVNLVLNGAKIPLTHRIQTIYPTHFPIDTMRHLL